MTKTSTLKRFASLFATLFVCLFASAEVVVIDFTKAPFDNLSGASALEQAGELTVQGIKISNTKGGRRANTIENGALYLRNSNTFKLIAPEGKPIKKILFVTTDREFIVDAEPGSVAQINSTGNRFYEWDPAINEVTFLNQTRFDIQHISKIEVTLDNPEVVFDFKDNFNTEWGVTNVPFSSKNYLEGKIADGYEVIQDGVILTTVNTRADRATRVKDGVLEVPPTHTFKLKAPAGKVISKVEFYVTTGRSAIKPEGQGELSLTKKVATYTGTTQEANFTGFGVFAKIKKIVITLAPQATPEPAPEPTPDPSDPTGIDSVSVDYTANANVYNLNGVVVGTENTFNNLPKGIYIIKGKKVIK